MTPEILASLEAARAAKVPVVLATRLSDGDQRLLPNPTAPDALNEIARKVLHLNVNGIHVVDGVDWFMNAYNPPLRLAVVGAVHIAQALVRFSTACGYATTVIDPRRSFASGERFPNVTISNDWPDEAMDSLMPDNRTAIVTLTHDPKLDDPALDRALKSDAFYIGALGSRKTHAARLKRLRYLGHSAVEMDRIHGPVGLDIEAVTAPEIAASIIAEIIAVRRGAALRPKVPRPS